MNNPLTTPPGAPPSLWQRIARVIFSPAVVGAVLAALISVAGAIYVHEYVVTPGPGPTVIKSAPNLPPTATIAATSTASPQVAVSLPNITVPGRAGSGVVFQAPQSGTYTFVISSGAYSPWPSPSYPGYQGWTDALFVYENRPVQWGIQPSSGVTEPISPDAQLGTWIYEPTPDEALSKTRGSPQQFSLKQGDQLIFIPVDQQGVYADNVGEVTVSVTFTP